MNTTQPQSPGSLHPDCSAPVDTAIADYVAMLERQNKYCRAKIERLTALLEVTRHYRIGHEVPMDWFIKRDQEIGNPAVVSPNDQAEAPTEKP